MAPYLSTTGKERKERENMLKDTTVFKLQGAEGVCPILQQINSKRFKGVERNVNRFTECINQVQGMNLEWILIQTNYFFKYHEATEEI